MNVLNLERTPTQRVELMSIHQLWPWILFSVHLFIIIICSRTRVLSETYVYTNYIRAFAITIVRLRIRFLFGNLSFIWENKIVISLAIYFNILLISRYTVYGLRFAVRNLNKNSVHFLCHSRHHIFVLNFCLLVFDSKFSYFGGKDLSKIDQ